MSSPSQDDKSTATFDGLRTPLMFVGGRPTDVMSGERRAVLNPATNAPIAHVPEASAADIDTAVAVARSAFESGVWSGLSRSDRARTLHRFAANIEASIEELYTLETLNNGRPVSETRAQLGRVGEYYRYTASLLVAEREDVIPSSGDHLVYLQRRPLGVCGILTPFNHPLLILAQSLSGALAAGNTVIVKPSELTPLTTLRLAEIAHESGIPEGVFNVVTGGAEAGAAIAAHADVAKVNFTGGSAGGHSIGTVASGRFARFTTELGGKTPVVVFDDAKMQDAVNGAAFAAFIASGQTCIAGSRLLIQDGIYDEFIDQLAQLTANIVIGDPSDPKTQLGPVISAERYERIMEYFDIATSEGATIRQGGTSANLPEPLDGGHFIKPTIITDVEPDMRVAREEIFGPVVVALRFSDEADAIAKANDSDFALGAAVWTQNFARAYRVASRIDAGLLWVNDHHRLEPSVPWGGSKASGMGKEAGVESYQDFTELKAVIVNTAEAGVDWYGATTAERRLN